MKSDHGDWKRFRPADEFVSNEKDALQDWEEKKSPRRLGAPLLVSIEALIFKLCNK